MFILDSAITSFVKVMNNHKINLENSDPYLTNINRLDDTSFNKTPTVINFDIMDSIRLFPVSNIEKEAIKNIDSNKEIVSSLKLGGIGGEYFKMLILKKIIPKTMVSILGKFSNTLTLKITGLMALLWD